MSIVLPSPQASFIERALRTSSLCAAYGLHFLITPDPAYGKADSAIDYGTPGVRKVCSLDSNHREQTLMKTFLPEYRIAALCNHLAILENKVNKWINFISLIKRKKVFVLMFWNIQITHEKRCEINYLLIIDLLCDYWQQQKTCQLKWYTHCFIWQHSIKR